MAYTRKISAVERYYVSCDTKDRTPTAFSMVAEGIGEVDVELLRVAVRVASLANPGSRLRLKGYLDFSRWVDSGKPVELQVISASDWSGFSSQDADFLDQPLRVRLDATFEVLFVKGASGSKHFLVFRAHHGVMDGRGIQHYARDLFRILNKQSPLGENSQSNDFELIKKINNKTTAENLFGDVAAATGVTSAANADLSSTWVRKTLAGKHRSLLGKVACALAKYSALNGESEIRLQVPVDLRRHFPGLNSTANLSGALIVRVGESSTYNDWDADIKSQLNQKKEAEIPSFFQYLPLSILNWIPQSLIAASNNRLIQKRYLTCRYRTTATISNVGLMQPDDFSGGGFFAEKIFYVPPEFGATALFLMLTGNEDGVELVARVPRFLDGGKLNELLDFIVDSVESEVEQKTMEPA